jgi:hypothetical protein
MKKIGIIIPYFGALPEWFPYFQDTSTYNKELHWFLFSDHQIPHERKPNFTFSLLQKQDFVDLVRKKTGFNVNIDSPYKLCDFKPLFGKIFEDFLMGFDFWGYSDVDMVYGNVSRFITNKLFKNYDIISTYHGYLSGPFSLFRNCEAINTLHKNIYDIENILADPKHYGIDENNNTRHHHISWPRKCMMPFTFIPEIFKSEIPLFPSMKELRYQFNWHEKRSMVRKDEFLDMSDVVYYFTKQKKIKTYFRELVYSDRQFERKNRIPWEVIWEKGNLEEKNSKKPLLAFHFIDLKNNLNLPPHKRGELMSFSINKNGVDI